MSICAGCGNSIPGWAHGSCPTCRRNKRDYKRYGRRRPGKAGQPSNRLYSKSTYDVKCSICGKSIRLDRLKDHMWIAHQKKRFRSNKKTKQQQKTRKPKARNKVGVKQRGSKRRIQAKPVTRQKSKPIDQHNKTVGLIRGINCLLEDIFGENTRISQILHSGGVSQSRIELIKRRNLDIYLSRVINEWVSWYRKIIPPGCIASMVIRYDLIADSAQKSRVVHSLSRLSPAEKQHLASTAVRSLRSTENQSKMQDIIIREAINLTNGNISGSSN